MGYVKRYLLGFSLLAFVPLLSSAAQDEKLASGTIERVSVRYFQIYMKYDNQPFLMSRDMEVKAEGQFKNKRIPLLKDMNVSLYGDKNTREVFHVVVHGPYSILNDIDKH